MFCPVPMDIILAIISQLLYNKLSKSKDYFPDFLFLFVLEGSNYEHPSYIL